MSPGTLPNYYNSLQSNAFPLISLFSPISQQGYFSEMKIWLWLYILHSVLEYFFTSSYYSQPGRTSFLILSCYLINPSKQNSGFNLIKPFWTLYLFSLQRTKKPKVHTPLLWYVLYCIILYNTISIRYLQICLPFQIALTLSKSSLLSPAHRSVPDHWWRTSSAYMANKQFEHLLMPGNSRLLYMRNTNNHKTVHGEFTV